MRTPSLRIVANSSGDRTLDAVASQMTMLFCPCPTQKNTAALVVIDRMLLSVIRNIGVLEGGDRAEVMRTVGCISARHHNERQVFGLFLLFSVRRARYFTRQWLLFFCFVF